MKYTIKDQTGQEFPTDFDEKKWVKSYCKTASQMFSGLILSVFENGEPIAHYKGGRLKI